jgi:hypothetical protein
MMPCPDNLSIPPTLYARVAPAPAAAGEPVGGIRSILPVEKAALAGV